MKRYILLLSALLFCGACESLKDTYSEYAGDGPIRYLAKCTNLTVKPGWKRLQVEWVNGVDPILVNIRVEWINDGVSNEVILPKDATSYNIIDLEDGNYEVRVSGLNAEGKSSLVESIFVRPYTLNHEVVRSVTQLVIKNFFVKDRLVLFFDNWSDKLTKCTLNYTLADGTPKWLELTKDIVEEDEYYLIYMVRDAIDPSKPVTLHREGYVEGCPDLIVFDTNELTHDRKFTSEFKALLRNRYGVEEASDAFVNGLEELEIDHTINSIEDILYFPNLKKLHLARNRFQWEPYLSYTGSASKIHEELRAEFVLDVAHQLYGLQVYRYNKHFNI